MDRTKKHHAVIGWPAVQPMLKALRDRYDQLSISMPEAEVYASGSLVSIVGKEVGGMTLKDGSTGAIDNLVTNIFERKEGSADPWLAYPQQAMIDARPPAPIANYKPLVPISPHPQLPTEFIICIGVRLSGQWE